MPTYYDNLIQQNWYKKLTEEFDGLLAEKIDNFDFVERNLKWPLRDYQKKALYTLQQFLKLDVETIPEKADLIEKLDGKDIAFYGFEMATGSGKTLLMGANILYFFKKGFRDFLIITPNTIIYDKTLKNFNSESAKSIFNENIGLSFNIITGDNYKDRTSDFDEDKDINIYIFNIQKFFEKGKEKQDETKGVPYTRRPIETSFWKDEQGNTISFFEFLRRRKLIIITDEAHHYQNKKSAEVIKEVLPDFVLEYTATAVERDKSRREQKIIYKYNLKNYIEDGWGKRIYAIGYAGEEKGGDNISEQDKKKIIYGLLAYLVKKEALDIVNAGIKPMVLIKARSIEHCKNIEDYLKNYIFQEQWLIKEVLEQVAKERTPLNNLITDYIEKELKNSIPKIQEAISKTAKGIFTIHSQNRKEIEVRDELEKLGTSEGAEIVNQVKIFTEGVDYDNFYILIVLGDSEEEKASTSVKQLIGRGVRLYKKRREFDGSTDILRQQTEILHIVCDKNKNFERVIEQVRRDLELSEKEFSFEPIVRIVKDEVDKEKIKNLKIPVLKERIVDKSKDFYKDISAISKFYFDDFINEVTYPQAGKKIFDLEINHTFEERDLLKEGRKKSEVKNLESKRFILNQDEIDSVIDYCILNSPAYIADHQDLRINLQKLLGQIFNKEIYLKISHSSQRKQAVVLFSKQFTQCIINKIKNQIFSIDYQIENKYLWEIFKDREVELKERNGKIVNRKNKEENFIARVDKYSTYFMGYNFSLYKYNRFDSNEEKITAGVLDTIIKNSNNQNNFWIRNKRGEYFLEYNGKQTPDFILRYNDKFYLIEIKGEYIEKDENAVNKKEAMKKINNIDRNIISVWLLDKDVKKVAFYENIKNIDDLIEFNKLENNFR